MSDSIWNFLVRRLGGAPGLEPTVNVGTHPIQNPAPAIPDPTAPPSGPITGPVGPTGPMMLDRETGRPLNEPPLPASAPGSQTSPWDKVKQAASQLNQTGAPRPMSGGMAAPQVHRGQALNLIDAVFGVNNRRNRDDY